MFSVQIVSIFSKITFFQFVLVETVTTGIMDKIPKLRNYKLRFVTGICTLMFVPGLVLTTNVRC